MALKKVGALWAKTDKKDNSFLSGIIDLGVSGSRQIFVFKNNKQNENSPDYVIQISKLDSTAPKPDAGQDVPELEEDIPF